LVRVFGWWRFLFVGVVGGWGGVEGGKGRVAPPIGGNLQKVNI